MQQPHEATDGIPFRRVTTEWLEQKAREQGGRAGLWASGGNSFFDNPREMRTVDPSDYELELGMGRDGIDEGPAHAWHTPLREGGKGRVIV